jgi:C4-dicarboxylate transporter DctM subunit
MFLLLLAFLILMIMGIPLALVLAGSGLVYLVFEANTPLSVVPQRMFTGVDDFTLMAIPLFILAGYLMGETGITTRLIAFAQILLRRVYGGLAQASVLVSMVFGGVSGVASADMAAVGVVMIPAMERDGYRRDFAASSILASSLMGAVIPPSITFIVYGVLSGASIGALLLAGAVPGVLIGLTIMGVNYVLLKRAGFVSVAGTLPMPSLSEALRITRDAAIGVIMPLVIIGGIVSGIFTATESAAVAVAYALVVGFFVYRTLHVRQLPAILAKSAIVSTVVMAIVVCSSVLGWALTFSQVPQQLAATFSSVTDEPAIFLLMVIALMLIIGMPLDPLPAVIITTPILLPAAIGFGIDPVHFGVVMVMTLVLGLATPPVGGSLFVASAISGVSVERLSITVLPFLAALLILTLLVTFVPETWQWLPQMMAAGSN